MTQDAVLAETRGDHFDREIETNLSFSSIG